MIRTNYISGIVKILEPPTQIFFNKNNNNEIVEPLKCRAQLSQARFNNMVELVFYGQLSDNIKNYYETNDYLIIEGYVSFRKNNTSKKSSGKKVQIIVTKAHPFLLRNKHT